MKRILVFAIGFMSMSAFADVPTPRVDYASAYNGYATISGGLEQQTAAPVGVTVQMGGLKYSTITDQDGKWSLVIRHTSVNYSVTSFNLVSANDRSANVLEQIK